MGMTKKSPPPATPRAPGAVADRPSFRAVYAEHVDMVWLTLRRLGVAEEWCDDATQEVFIVVDRLLPKYVPRGKFTTWLFAIAHNVAGKFRYREARRMDKVEPDLDDTGDDIADPFDLEGAVASEDEVRRLLDQLEPELRIVFIMHDIDRAPSSEVAEALGIKHGTAKTRIRLARQRVREAWARLHRETRSNVVAIGGPMTFMEAGRQVPPISAERRARIWQGIQDRIGGGDGGDGDDGQPTENPRRGPGVRAYPAGQAVALLLTAGLGVVVGAVWDPLHRPRGSELAATVATSVAAPPPPPPPSAPPVVSEPSDPRPPGPNQGPPQGASSTSASAATLDAEAALMDRANALLSDGSYSEAIAACRQHAARFPGGRLLEQRETCWLLALMRSGRTTEARARLPAFETRFPQSAVLKGIRQTLGDAP
jgi:RNA polymerase sigma-70 factor, ECF subfamily